MKKTNTRMVGLLLFMTPLSFLCAQGTPSRVPVSVPNASAAQYPHKLDRTILNAMFLEMDAMLQRLVSANEEKQALERTRVTVDRLGSKSGHTFALFSPAHDAVVINQEILEAAYLRLKGQGVPLADIPEVLAAHYLPVLCHELRHAINHWYLRAVLGDAILPALVEDEYSARITHLAVYEEIRRLFPMDPAHKTFVSKSDDQQWQAWREQGVTFLDRRVQEYAITGKAIHLRDLIEKVQDAERIAQLDASYLQEEVLPCNNSRLCLAPDSPDEWIHDKTGGRFVNRKEARDFVTSVFKDFGVLRDREKRDSLLNFYGSADQGKARALWQKHRRSPITTSAD